MIRFPMFLLGVILAVSGCGGPEGGRVGVTGEVLLDGKPLPSGMIALYDDKGSAGVGRISNGSFQLDQSTNNTGIRPGSYKVAIESWKTKPGDLLPDGKFSPGESAIPPSYTTPGTSQLTAKIPVGGTRLKFDLKSTAPNLPEPGRKQK